MSYSVTSPHKSGTIGSISNNIITIGTGSDTPAAADVSRSSSAPSNNPRILMITSGNARGQFRKIIAQTSTTYTLDYPFNISAYRSESYSNGDRVTEVNPSAGDKYVLSRTMKEIYDLAPDGDGTWADNAVDTNLPQYYEMAGAETSTTTDTLTLGGTGTDETCVLYDESMTFKFRMNRLRVQAQVSDEIKGAMVFGYTNPGFRLINHYVSGTDTNIAAGQIVQDDDGTIYTCLISTSDVNTSTDFSATDANGNPRWTDALNLVNGYTEYGCTIIDTHDTDGGSAQMGPAFFNGCKIIFDPIGSTSGPWTESTTNETFWRWFTNDDSIIRMWECDVLGPSGGRFQGEKSILLDTAFRLGGQDRGSFNPVSSSDSYFGLIKGCTFDGKSQALYVRFQNGPLVELESPIFRNISTDLFFLGSGTDNNDDLLRLKNFNVRQLLDRTAFGDSSVNFINNENSGTLGRADIVQDVTVAYMDSNIENITDRQLKLAYTDAQSNNGPNTIVSETSSFDTQELTRWFIDPIPSGSVSDPEATNFSDGTDNGPFDFMVLSYEDNNQTFQNDLDDSVLTTRIMTSDNRVTKTRSDAQLASFTEITSTADAYDAMKIHKYENPYDGGVTNPLFMDKNTSTNTLFYSDETIDPLNVTFSHTDGETNPFTYSATGLTFNIGSTADMMVNIDVGTANDIDVNDHTIGGSVTAREIFHEFADGDTIVATSSINTDIVLDTEIKLNTGTYTIDASRDADDSIDISDLTLTRNDGQTNCNVLLKGDVTGTPTLNNVNLRKEVSVTLTLEEAYSSTTATHSAHATDSANDLEGSDLTDSSPSSSGNDVTFTFEIDNDQRLSFAILIDQYEPYYVITDGDVEATLTKYSTTILDTSQTTTDVDTVSTNTTVSWVAANSRVEFVVPNTALNSTTTEQAKTFVWKMMRKAGYLQAIAQRRILVDEIDFEEVGIIVDQAADAYRVYFDKTAGNNAVEPNCELKTSGGTDLSSNSDLVDTSDIQRRVRFNTAATINIINVDTLTQITDISKDNIEEILDGRDMTKTNQERLGKLQPIEVS